MLISKGITTGETVTIKLISGEEIIARLEEDNTHTIKIHKPLSVSIGPQGLGMMPFMFLGDSTDLEIKKEHVIAMAVSKKDAADQYIQGTTGIKIL
jgi:hypothetical protein